MMVAAWLIIDHTKVVESSSRMPSHIDTEGGRVYKFFFKAAHTSSLIHRVMLYICMHWFCYNMMKQNLLLISFNKIMINYLIRDKVMKSQWTF